MMKKYLNIFVNGLLAGICISIGGWVFVRLQSDNFMMAQLNAPLMFAIALTLICFNRFYLYTGKICYLFDKDQESIKSKLLSLGIGLISNYIGVFLVSLLIKISFETIAVTDATKLTRYVSELITSKVTLTWYDCLIRGFFCGLLVYFAVDSYKLSENKIVGLIILIMCVMTFILCGFEHSIADMFYLSLDNTVSLQSICNILLIILGNSLGGLFIPLLKKV